MTTGPVPRMYQAALLTVVASLLIPLGDGVSKYAYETHNAPVQFMAWARFFGGAIIFTPLMLARGITLSETCRPAPLMRGLVVAISISIILQAGARAPLAETFGGFFVAPLVSFLLATTTLGERPGWRRWALILAGFVGVLLVVRPGANMSFGLALAVIAGCFYGTFLWMNRLLAGRHRPLAMLWAQLLVGAVVIAPTAFPLPPLTWAILGLASVSALTSATANYLLIVAYRMAEATRLAPLVYFQLVGAVIFGALFFGALPDPQARIGLGLLFASGLGALALGPKRRQEDL